jgi:hypothetical protein
VTVNPETGCWEWQLSCLPGGYGQTGACKTEHRVHRLAFLAFKGPIPAGGVVRHRCHNRPCCNPKHLLLGTHQDNTDDTKRDQRSLGHQTLTAPQVKQIRRLLAKGKHAQREIGEMFGVSQVTISRVKLGVNHAHI